MIGHRVYRIRTWNRGYEIQNEAKSAGERMLLGNRHELPVGRLVERDERAALILRVVSWGTGRKGSVLGFVGGLGEILWRDNVEGELGGHGGCNGVNWRRG